jgi:hypothetical protein
MFSLFCGSYAKPVKRGIRLDKLKSFIYTFSEYKKFLFNKNILLHEKDN